MSFNVPTILIGLGGIGSNIANMIYGSIPKEQRSRVAIHAFDTDSNSIAQLDHLRNSATQTSTNHSVDEYLRGKSELYKWFPNNPILRKKQMTSGAGQVRAISRLAFRSAMSEGKLNAMWDGIEKIFPVDSDTKSYSVRVIILSSLVGGTGSGIFLQVALYLREMLEKKLNSESVLIRGAFLLPDILVRSKTIDQKEFEAVQANGYASLKELNALTLSASGHHKGSVTIELEYRPNQVDLEGNIAHAITDRHLPYDFCFLWDYENTRGKNLTNVSEYMDQVARAVYLQLFSPISARSFSQEDNQIRNLVDSNGQARYCGAGVASLSYPYEDLLEYCSLKWSVNGLNDSWLKLDRIYNENKKKYELDLRKGINAEQPEIKNQFISYFDSYASEPENPNPFFRQIDLQVHEVDKKGRKVASKAELFLEEVEKYALSVINNDEELKVNFESHCKLDDGRLKVKDLARQEVSRVEAALEDYASEIEKKINEYSHFIVHQIIDTDYHNQEGTDGKSYRLNTWLLKKSSPVHPVGVRYILYSIHKLLGEKIAAVKEESRRFKDQIERYKHTYDLDRNDGIEEDAPTRVDKALRQNLFTRTFRNQFNYFIEEYTNKSNQQFRALNHYKRSKLLEKVFSAINQSIKEMIDDWQRFFDNLIETKETLQDEINQLSRKFEGVSDPTKQFVLASKDMMEQTWERIRQSVDNGLLPDNISQKIYVSLYNRFIERKNKRLTEGVIKEKKVEDFFKENVLAFCRQELESKHSDKLDFTIIQALKMEADRFGEDPEQYIYNKITALKELAQPFVPITENHGKIHYWGLHHESNALLTEKLRNELFKEKEIVDDAFKRNEMICYRAHYGLCVSDFSKFSSGKNGNQPGVYYEAYQRLIRKLNKDETRTITPHLDKNWHLPAYMPDLNPEEARLEREKAERALLLGAIYGWLQLVNFDGVWVYQYTGKPGTGTKLILKNSEKVKENISFLHEALPHNPVIYDEILERFQESQEDQIRNVKNIDEHLFLKGAMNVSRMKREGIRNILDVALAYELENLKDSTHMVQAESLRKCLLNEISDYFIKAYREESAKRNAGDFIKQLWERSYIRNITSESLAEYSTWITDMNNKLDELKQDRIAENKGIGIL